MEGIIVFYFPFFSAKKYFTDEDRKHLNKTKSWPFIDSSFNDFFINIFLNNSEIKSIPEELISSDFFNYQDELSNCLFTFETKLKYRDYKYLNIIKCGLHFQNLNITEIHSSSFWGSKNLLEIIDKLDIPEFFNKSSQIKEQLFIQKLKTQIVLIDKNVLSLTDRKYSLLDLALDKNSGTAKKTIENIEFQERSHSKSYLESLLNNSIIDQYQEWTTIITQKKIITVYNFVSKDKEGNLLNNSVQFGLIYINKIIVSELLTSLNLWINENKFENNLELSKYYMRFSRNFDFKLISTKNLYNEYSNLLVVNLKINDEKEIINMKIKEIENILEKEKNQLTNLLLFSIAIIQLITAFIDDLRNGLASFFNLNKGIIGHYISIFFIAICLFLVLYFMKKRKI